MGLARGTEKWVGQTGQISGLNGSTNISQITKVYEDHRRAWDNIKTEKLQTMKRIHPQSGWMKLNFDAGIRGNEAMVGV